uniref:Uncharacterized protein n=1 Tax=Anguilla anguilla TaxID=7936 RepID=A0A0E9TRI8_ANGAN
MLLRSRVVNCKGLASGKGRCLFFTGCCGM